MAMGVQRGERGIEATEEWRAAADSILGGIRHDLNGRIGVVSGIAQLARVDGALDEELSETLVGEVARLEHLSALIGLIAGDREPREALIRVSDLVNDAVELTRRHRGLTRAMIETVTEEDGVVLVHRSRLVKALVVLLVAAAGSGAARVRTAAGDGGDFVEILIEGADGTVGVQSEPGGAEADARARLERALEAVQPSIAGLGGEVGWFGCGVRLRLPVEAG